MRHRVRLVPVLSALILSVLAGAPTLRSEPPRPTGEAPPTFYRDVLPILQERCQGCHRVGEIAPMPLVTFDQAHRWARAIAQMTKTRQMPPWFAERSIGHFSNDPSLTRQQIATLAAWAASGAAAGDPRDAPPTRHWAQGWNIAKPDAVVKMPQPVALPAEGDVDYTYEIVPTGFTEDRWVRMSEIRPSMRANVHHAVVYVRPPDSTWLRHAPVGVPFTAASLPDEEERREAMFTKSDLLLVYAPGSAPDEWPEGAAKLIPRGSDLVFQMHYITRGRAVSDQTSIGLVFAKQPPKQRVLTLQLSNSAFVIPPNWDDYQVEARGSLPNDATLLSFFPHMHLRGKQFEYDLIGPEGTIMPLLRVHYDFHWQLSYRLAQPLALKAGTILKAVAWYDNSWKNPHNPNPNVAVRWGDQTYDEMMVGFFDVAIPADMDKEQYFIRQTGVSGAGKSESHQATVDKLPPSVIPNK